MTLHVIFFSSFFKSHRKERNTITTMLEKTWDKHKGSPLVLDLPLVPVAPCSPFTPQQSVNKMHEGGRRNGRKKHLEGCVLL